MKNNSLYLASTIVLASMLGATTAVAQSVDYGAAEQMFGEPVTTSATGSPLRSTEAPADMQIISAAEIRQSGETSIPGILQRAAGIDVLNEFRRSDGRERPRLRPTRTLHACWC